MPFVHENVKVELFPGTPSPIVYLSENDVGDTVAFELVYKGQPVSIPNGSIFKFNGTKKDGLGFTINSSNVSGNVISFIVSEDMTSCSGVVEAEISITSNNNKHGTCNVVLIVEKNPHSDGVQDGSYPQIVSEMRELVSQIEGDAEIAADAKNIALQVQQDVHQYTADSINDWLDEHPEATTTVQDGAITEAKLANNIYLDKYRNIGAVPDSNLLLSDIGIDTTQLYTLQGGCYNSNNNHIVLVFHKANNPDCIVKELDEDWNLLNTVTLTLYHANDMTYNSKTNKYYVADGENANTIYEIDSGLSSVRIITVSVGGVVAQISYDAINDRYYLLVNRNIYTCDPAFSNIVYHATLDTTNDYSGVQSIYTGGSCMFGGSFVSMVWFYRDSAQPESNTRLYFANANKDYDGYYFDFRSHTMADEQEALLEFPDKIVCVGYYAENITRTNIYTGGTRQGGMICLIGNIYSNVNRVPVNSYGVCTIKASSSPTDEDITGAYICYGKYDMRTLRITTQDMDYYRYCYGSNTWTQWHNNKEILNSLIVSQAINIATGVTIGANTSTPEYAVEVPYKAGYTPFCVIHRQVSAPVVFPWYIILVTSSAESGFAVKARYRNTYSVAQENQNITAIVLYVRIT